MAVKQKPVDTKRELKDVEYQMILEMFKGIYQKKYDYAIKTIEDAKKGRLTKNVRVKDKWVKKRINPDEQVRIRQGLEQFISSKGNLQKDFAWLKDVSKLDEKTKDLIKDKYLTTHYPQAKDLITYRDKGKNDHDVRKRMMDKYMGGGTYNAKIFDLIPTPTPLTSKEKVVKAFVKPEEKLATGK